MFAAIVTITVLAVLYGVAWHNQPPKKRKKAQRDNSK